MTKKTAEELPDMLNTYEHDVDIKIPVLNKTFRVPGDEYFGQVLGLASELILREPRLIGQVMSVNESDRSLTIASINRVAVEVARSLVLNTYAIVAQDIVEGVPLDAVNHVEDNTPTDDPNYRQD